MQPSPTVSFFKHPQKKHHNMSLCVHMEGVFMYVCICIYVYIWRLEVYSNASSYMPPDFWDTFSHLAQSPLIQAYWMIIKV